MASHSTALVSKAVLHIRQCMFLYYTNYWNSSHSKSILNSLFLFFFIAVRKTDLILKVYYSI